jgi:hypothetical protein
MSSLRDDFAAIGSTLEEAVRNAVEGNDALLQLRALRTEVRTERTIGDHRWETLNAKLDEVNSRLDEIIVSMAALRKALGLNGSGGHHG